MDSRGFGSRCRVKHVVKMAKNRYFQVTIFLSVVLLALTFALPLWRLFPGITERFAIPLHYNIHSGVDSFGPWERIFTIPEISGIILVLNLLIAVSLWKRDKVLSYFFVTVGMLAQLFALIAMIFVVYINLIYA